MGMHRCDRCAGQGVIHGASGLGAGGAVNSAHPVIWIFSIFGALVFANAPLFGLNWFVSGFIGLLIGAAIGGVLLSTRIGRIILWALGLGFVVLVLIQVFRG